MALVDGMRTCLGSDRPEALGRILEAGLLAAEGGEPAVSSGSQDIEGSIVEAPAFDRLISETRALLTKPERQAFDRILQEWIEASRLRIERVRKNYDPTHGGLRMAL